MIFLCLFLGIAHAEQLIERPEPPEKVEGECRKVYPIRMGQPLPATIVSPSGNSLCSGVVVPLSQYADLLSLEEWGKAIAQQYSIDVASLEMERDWYKEKLEQESQPVPFLERPGTQRWFGRLETLVTVGVVAVGLGAAYNYGSGGLR